MDDPNVAPLMPGSQALPLSQEMNAEENFKQKVQPDFIKHALADMGVQQMILQALSQPVAVPSPVGSVGSQPLPSSSIGQPAAQSAPQQQSAGGDQSAGGGSFNIPTNANPMQSLLNAFTSDSPVPSGSPQQSQNSATLAALETNPNNLPTLY